MNSKEKMLYDYLKGRRETSFDEIYQAMNKKHKNKFTRKSISAILRNKKHFRKTKIEHLCEKTRNEVGDVYYRQSILMYYKVVE